MAIMRHPLRALVCLPSLLLVTSGQLTGTLSTAAEPAATRADQLVRDALQAELDDVHGRREQLLGEALEVAPNHAPARWHSGYVRLDDQWTRFDAAASHVAGDRLLAAYQKRRAALVDTADSHRELARWCAKRQLPAEARAHWAQVLEFHPQDAEALRALKLTYRDGQLVSQRQLDQQKQTAAAQQQRLRDARPRLEAWQRTLRRGDQAAVDSLLDELRAMRDVADVSLLIAALSLDRNGRHADAVRGAVFESLASIRSPEATQFFLRQALADPDSPAGAAALDALRQRPAYAFVPQLLAELPPEITAQGSLNVLAGGAVVHERQVRVADKNREVTFSYENVVSSGDRAAAVQVVPQVAQRELTKAAISEAQVRALQEEAQTRRERIQQVLTRATSFTHAESSDDWERQYENYYGLYTPAQEKHYHTQHVSSQEGYFTPPTVTTTVTSRTRLSCFAAGTPVATIHGPRAIETLQVGDRVLTQDTVTGELAFEPLVDTTLRPAIELIEIRCGASAPILATPGHPFWVVGHGWQIARLLRPGDRLHGVQGAVTIDGVQVRPAAEAYNLVVGDFHTYFVGDDVLLVHDNAPLVEQPQLVPGL